MFSMEITRLIEQCRLGDPDALGELYRAYATRMRGVCRWYVSDEQTIDDLLHDAFVIIFTSFDKLRDDNKAEAWMTAITRNVASKYKEHLEALPTIPIDETHDVVSFAAGDAERDVRGVPLDEVVKMIDTLPEGYGQVFRLSVFEGMSHKEIATLLGIEPHSSSSQLARAKKMLRKMMQHYWAAVLLLLLVPLTFILLRKEDAAVDKGGSPVVAKQETDEAGHPSSPKELPTERPQEPVKVHLPVRQTPVVVADTTFVAEALYSLTLDTLSNTTAQAQTGTDTIATDTIATGTPRPATPSLDYAVTPSGGEAPVIDKPAIGTSQNRRWSLELAYAGQFNEQHRYNQPYVYQPYVDPNRQESPTQGGQPTYIAPSSIDNWTDYAVYLANHPDAVSDKTRSVVMRIALNNANQPGADKILRTSHHQMPVTWSLALKYRLTDRFALESGLSYSRLSSDFEMGSDDRPVANGNVGLGKNVIREQQTIHYLGIPVKGICNVYGRKQWSLYGSLGVTTEIPVRSTLHADYLVNGQHEATDETTLIAPWQLSTTFGLGLQCHLTPRVGLFVEPSLQYYIPMQGDIETYRTEHPFTFTLPIGIRFSW